MDQLHTAIKSAMIGREASYDGETHDRVMLSVRSIKRQAKFRVRGLYVICSLCAVFSGWNVARAFEDSQVREFVRIALESLSLDIASAPIYFDIVFEFLPQQWSLFFLGNAVVFMAGLTYLKLNRRGY